MAGNELERCSEPDDPERCQGSSAHGQCMFKVMPGTQYCRMHGGHQALKREAATKRRRYTLGIYQKNYDDEMDAGQIKNLHEEVVLTRVLIQNYLTVGAQSETEMLRMAPVIQNQIGMLEKLVKTMDHMDRQAGNLLDKAKVQVLGQQIAEVVAKYVTDPELMLKIGTEIGEIMERLDKPNGT